MKMDVNNRYRIAQKNIKHTPLASNEYTANH